MNFPDILLPLAIAVPFIASLFLLALGRYFHTASQTFLALTGAIFPMLAGVILWAKFDGAIHPENGYAFLTTLPLGMESLGISLIFGLNGISLPLFALAGIVGAAAGILAVKNGTAGKMLAAERPYYLGLLLFIISGLLGVFASVDLFFFYFFHEFALIPTFILILFWGGLGRRLAAIQMAVYLTIGAMISLAGIILLVLCGGAESFSIIALRTALSAAPLANDTATIIFALLLFGFGILVSLFPFHSWAAPAYTEAPTPVSMLHAGVLKKFGLYGLVQIGAFLLPLEAMQKMAPVLLWLALGNIVFIGFVTLSQRHLKEMIAYSSVMHMGPCFLGIYAFIASGGDTTGLGAAVLLMFAHGLSVSLLFAFSHAIYQRTGTLEFAENGGLAKMAPVLAAFFVAASMASIGLPGFANFWGELGIFVALGKLPVWLLALVVSSIVISAIYMLRAIAKIFLGGENDTVAKRREMTPIRDITPREKLVALLLFAALVAAGFYPKIISEPLNNALKNATTPAGAIIENAGTTVVLR